MSTPSPPPPPPDAFLERALSTDWLTEEMFVWKNLVLLALVVVLFITTKVLFVLPVMIRKRFTDADALSGFTTLDDMLVRADNKAVAMQFSGFMLGVGLVVRGSLSTSKADLGDQVIDFMVFTMLGLVLVGVSHALTDLVILRKINSITAVFADENFAVATMVAALHVCTGLLVAFSITEQNNSSLGEQIGVTVMWWTIGHFFLIVFSLVYELLSFKYDDNKEIAAGNTAAAVGYGLTLIANTLMIISPVSKSDSLLAAVLSWGIGSVVLFALRFIIDFTIFPGRRLDDEISEDQNWGASLIEGFASVAFSLVWWALYRPDLSDACVPDPPSE